MAEVETDKARVTIPCPTTGRVLELRANIGDRVPVGEVMAVFEPAVPLPAPVAQPAASAPRAMATPSPARADQIIPLRGVRRAIARTMTEAWRTIPHIIDFREADATALSWRDVLRERAAQATSCATLTITPLLLRIAVEALRGHPYVNASIDLEREEITLHGELQHRHRHRHSRRPDRPGRPRRRRQVGDRARASRWPRSTHAARERRLRPEQLAGGTFTLSNYGSLGGWLGTPIIRPGEVGDPRRRTRAGATGRPRRSGRGEADRGARGVRRSPRARRTHVGGVRLRRGGADRGPSAGGGRALTRADRACPPHRRRSLAPRLFVAVRLRHERRARCPRGHGAPPRGPARPP